MALPTKIKLNVVTPDQSYSHDVDEVSLPGSEGDFYMKGGIDEVLAAAKK